MSIDLNQVVIAGNLGADAEVTYTANGQAVVRFRAATTRRFNSNGQKREETSWLRYVVFGDMGEKLLPYLTKGKPVIVTGRIEQRTYQAKDGTNRESIEIVVQRLQLLGDSKGGTNTNTASAPAAKRATKVEAEDDTEFDDIPF